MTEDRVAKAIDLLERIAEHDHQGDAIRLWQRFEPTDCPLKRLEAYGDCLERVANTDIQSWAKLALRHLKGAKMSDDLVKRLRDWEHVWPDDMDKPAGHLYDDAANCIEELEAKLDWVLVERDETFALMLDRAQTAEAKLAKAVEFIEIVEKCGNGPLWDFARATLAELTGGKDE